MNTLGTKLYTLTVVRTHGEAPPVVLACVYTSPEARDRAAVEALKSIGATERDMETWHDTGKYCGFSSGAAITLTECETWVGPSAEDLALEIE